MKIYVAGSSRDLTRCTLVIQAIQRMPNAEITLDWTESIRQFGGDAQDNRTVRARAETAWADVDAVLAADVLVLLLPRVPTKGAWAELGVALAHNRLMQRAGVAYQGELSNRLQHEKFIFAAWEDEHMSESEDLPLFVAPAHKIFRNDRALLSYMELLLDPDRDVQVPYA